MTAQNTSANINHEQSDNISWQRVLNFGTEIVTEKMKSQPQNIPASVFIVLP
jgi:hypothetical protein